MLDAPDLVIADEFLLNNGGPTSDVVRVGDTITLADPVSGVSRKLTVAALAVDDYLVSGTFVGYPNYEAIFGDRAVASRFLVAADDATGSDEVSASIGRAFASNGAESNTIVGLVDGVLAQSTGFFTLMQQFVGVGLLVGIAGLGVVMIRSVRERRRDIGVLRAIGLEPAGVGRSFLFEASFVAAEGIVLGVVVALVGTYGLVLNGSGFMAGFSWAVPWGAIVVVTLLTLAAAAMTAVVPAVKASRIRPAQALRLVD